MTIRSHVNVSAANDDFEAFEEACARAPEGTYEWSKTIREEIGDACDNFLKAMKDAGAAVCNCDGIREIEVMMFTMIRRANPMGEIETAIGLGRALRDPAADDEAILYRLRRDRDFLAAMRAGQNLDTVEVR